MDLKRVLLWLIAIVGVLSILQLPPIAQDTLYHSFADQNNLLGIQNFWNVFSNLPFLIIGLYGLAMYKKYKENLSAKGIDIPFLIFVIGVGLVSIGSSYYHYAPSNETLFWDRLPMTIAFMALYAMIVSIFIAKKSGKALLPWLLLCGVLSVIYWLITETIGIGDLRLYALVQFLPMVLIIAILWLYKDKSVNQGGLLWVMIWYGIAKALETFDLEVFKVLDMNISGHSLKHIAAAIASLILIRWAIKISKKNKET